MHKPKYAKAQRSFAFDRPAKRAWIQSLNADDYGISPRQMPTVKELLRQIELTSTNGCMISVPKLAKAMGGRSERTVQRARAIAEKAGLLSVTSRETESGRHISNHWQVCYPGMTDEMLAEARSDPTLQEDDVVSPIPDVVSPIPDVVPPIPDVVSPLIENSREGEEVQREETPDGVCGEQAPPPPSEFDFPTTGRGPVSWNLPEKLLGEYVVAYQWLNVRQEIAKARQWCLANPPKRKTAKGMPRFLTNWLNTAQNRNRGPTSAGAHLGPGYIYVPGSEVCNEL